MPDKPASASKGSEHSRLAIALPIHSVENPERQPVREQPADVKVTTIDEQLDLLISDEELMRLRALDELERVTQRRPHGVRHHIPL
jgi:hypothetical protein